MAEGKTKKPVSKVVRKTTKAKKILASSKSSVTKKPVVKKVVVKSAKGGSTSGEKAPVKKIVAKPKSARKTKPKKNVQPQPSEAFVMPDIILPKPITLTNPENITVESVRTKRPITFSQHVISIVALAIIGIIALFSVTSYYFITLTYIDAESVQPLLRKPTTYIDKAFQTSAGRLAVHYPNYWEVGGIQVDEINLQDTWTGDAKTSISVHQTELDSVVQWLKDNPPQYKNFQLTQLPKELADHEGIYALADGEAEGQKIMMFYFLQDTYVISTVMTYQGDDSFTEKNKTAYYAVIKNLEIE